MKDDKALEKLVDTLFEEDQLASPSPDFTKNVMAKLEQEETQRIRYAHQLPKWPLLIPAAFFVVCVIYVLNKIGIAASQPDYLTFFRDINLGVLEFSSQFNFSDALGYSVAIICLAICFQVIVLKRRLDQRFA